MQIGSNLLGGNMDSSYNLRAQSIFKGRIEADTHATCISGPVAIKIRRSLWAHVTAVTSI